MTELELKYGCNPNQKPSKIFMRDGSELPVTVLNGKPGYINFLDALNSWQLVKELKEATGMPSAASFKHVSPAGAAVGKPLSDVERQMYFVEPDAQLSPIACAYIRARGTDRLSSYGDWAALSDVCDAATAQYLKAEVSDGVIAPGYTEEALEILRSKKKGGYNVVQVDPDYVCAPQEFKDVFGVTFQQGHNDFKIGPELLQNIVTANKDLPEGAKIDMIVSLITLKYTQSNSVCYAQGGQVIGVGAGQQSRIHCPGWRETRRISGGCARTPRCWAFSSSPTSAGPTGTTPSTSISPRSGRMCWGTTCGSRPSPSGPSPLLPLRRRNGSPNRPGSPWAAMPSSPSATMWSGPGRAASASSPSPAAPSGMTTSSPPPTSTVSSWPSPGCGCFTTNSKQASYPSLPGKPESSLILLFLVSPAKLRQSFCRGPHFLINKGRYPHRPAVSSHQKRSAHHESPRHRQRWP